jgi:hypothetical protein
MAFNYLARLLMQAHLLFGLNIGFQHIGLEPYCRSINLEDTNLMRLSRRILLSRSSMMILLMVRLLQKNEVPYNRKHMRERLKHIIAPCFSLKPCNSSFRLYARIKGNPTYSICRIEILPSPASHLVVLQLKTLSKPPKPNSMDHWKYIEMMPKDDRVYVFDVKKVETKELIEKRSKATQNSFSLCAKQGEYFAADHENGSIKISYQKKVTRFVMNAYSWLICATAFHQTLPILATYSGVEKIVKLWYVPPGLSSDPVLISSFEIPDGCVLSIAFHPTLPLIFCGKNNGDIEVWRAV